ncbi:glycosyltransferase family 87 protein [Pelagovum pacificum]|uniref:DUF2029 domain-containing protein n=1 Tax=Pelagovum pacificum TaxID=2588711 RepID=A0A5C5GGD9_9RHOB|nr:glycosyltransferase family 87 protein [Pelagovum pacificum]QQA43763.1 DUF2029 domain-containing protein [Pelagovum pacificum]TNY33107.1 DUF2029 domain-containing protein [Pelagovum pacificum]
MGQRGFTDRIDVAVSILLLAAALVLLIRWFGGWAVDLSAVYVAARAYGEGLDQLVYAAPERFFGPNPDPAVAALLAEAGSPGMPTVAFVYPPLWAALLSPAAAASTPEAFFAAARIVQTVLILGGAVLAWRLGGRGRWPLTLWLLANLVVLSLTMPGMTALWHAQPTLTVVALILLALERHQAGWPIMAGLALGVAAAIKLTPLVFCLVFLLNGDRRAALVTIATTIGLAALSLGIAGPELHLSFLEQLSRARANLMVTAANYSLLPLLVALTDGANPGQGFEILPAPAWAGLVGLCLLLGGIALLLRCAASWPAEDRTVRLAIALSILLILASPIGWSHYAILPLLLAPALLCRMPPARALMSGLVLLVLLSPFTQFRLPDVGLLSLMCGPLALLILLALLLKSPGRGATSSLPATS